MARKEPWAKQDEETLRTMYCDQGATVPEIARALGRTMGSVRTKAQYLMLHRTATAVSVAGVPVQAVDPVEAERERQEASRRLREEREALREIAGERSLRRTIETIMRDIVPRYQPAPPRKPKDTKTKKSRETAILCLSDWHWGEVVDIERTRGFNEYNVPIARQRAKRIFDSARSILARLQSGAEWSVPRLVISVNGDMLTGTIHDLERHADGKTIVQSTYECAMYLAELIRDAAPDFERVDVFFTAGNHGRMAAKMESKDPSRSWDAVCGLFVKTALEHIPNVTVEVPNAYTCAFEVEGWTVVQTHGHQIKGGSFGGLPWYGINRMVTGYNALEASRGGSVLAWLLGHFHSAGSLPNVGSEVFVNGSLISGTEWVVETLGKNDRPCQWLLGVHKDHGITHRWPIYADEGRFKRVKDV
jgi:hypothetical protein